MAPPSFSREMRLGLPSLSTLTVRLPLAPAHRHKKSPAVAGQTRYRVLVETIAAHHYLPSMRIIRAMALLAIIAACAPLDMGPRLAAYRLLVPGQSTTQDATTLLGWPTSATAVDHNTILAQWMNGAQYVAITFGSGGRMIGVQQVSGL
jgi:hypothetical protein